MEDRESILYQVDGVVVADIRTADELVKRITLYAGYAVVEKVKLSEKSRGGIILPNADAKDEQHLMLYRVVAAGPPLSAGDDTKKKKPPRAVVGHVVILKPSVAQFLVNQRHQFGVIMDNDIIGDVTFDKAPGSKGKNKAKKKAKTSKKG